MISDFNSMDGGSDNDKIKEAIAKNLLGAGFSGFVPSGTSYASEARVQELATTLMQLAEVTQDLSSDLIDAVSNMSILEKHVRIQETQIKIMLDVITMINDDVNYLKLPWYKKLFHKKKKHDE